MLGKVGLVAPESGSRPVESGSALLSKILASKKPIVDPIEVIVLYVLPLILQSTC